MSTESVELELELARLEQLQHQLVAADCDAGLFYDPINVRYATGTTNMSVYALHHPCRYALVPASGTVTLFDFKTCEHLSDGHPAVGEVRDAVSWYHFITGPRTAEFAEVWAAEIAAVLGTHAGRRRGARPRLAVDRLDPLGLWALERLGVEVVDGNPAAGLARAVKCDSEVAAIRAAVTACEKAIAAMETACEPGITEQQLWAVMHSEAIAGGGEWFETRLLTSGPRTNPWYQECSDRVIRNGDLVAFDTDHVGLGGYTVDVSRTWLAGDARRTPQQRDMYAAALEQVQHNVEMLWPGVTFAELSQRARLPPDGMHSPANACVAHGVGLCNEYPLVLNRHQFAIDGYDGVLEANMVLCVESLVAPPGGSEAVKLEEQVLITPSGPEVLSASPWCDALLD